VGRLSLVGRALRPGRAQPAGEHTPQPEDDDEGNGRGHDTCHGTFDHVEDQQDHDGHGKTEQPVAEERKPMGDGDQLEPLVLAEQHPVQGNRSDEQRSSSA
jgi:hypothetical protein